MIRCDWPVEKHASLLLLFIEEKQITNQNFGCLIVTNERKKETNKERKEKKKTWKEKKKERKKQRRKN